MTYVAVDIGCIECGESSSLLGVYNIEEAAYEVVRVAYERYRQAEWHGQHEFRVFDTTDPGDYSLFSCDDFAPEEQSRRRRADA